MRLLKRDRVIKVLFLFFLFFMFLFFNLIVMPINCDEVWNYGFSNNIYRGLIPYKDFNIILTPFYPFLMSIGFHLFDSNILVFHIEHAILLTVCCYFLFKLFHEKAWIFIFFFFFPKNFVFPSYNCFLFILLVIIIYMEKKYSDSNTLYQYLIGFLLAICVLTKHSVGFFLLLPSLYYIKNKKILLKRLIGFIIPIFSFVLYLIFTKSITQFCDLCVLGMFDFAGNNPGINIYLVLSLIIVGVTIYFIIKDRRDINNYYVLAFYSIVIPLFDLYHFWLLFLSFLFILLPKIKKSYIKYSTFTLCCLISLMIFYMRDDLGILKNYPNNLNRFEYRYVDSYKLTVINEVLDFMKEKDDEKIVFISANAYYFKIAADLDCGYLDLVNIGNWGYNGSSKLLSIIKQNKNALFLVDPNELGEGYQTDRDAIKYILVNGKKIDTVGFYDVYVME